ncbi:hypothetical protein G7Y89_g4635 [Cudoniella acicularis]|uniref:3-beta hydroxysteroid dehydrogenase/isomerase domain-containing protein n=1 Tax=Cudoniella acicularis TaxID=354080 RepID=A0A8H4W4S7_9HELO|nr:hypothetical protein G7Y89_g4635 [Cudoniella acicularis]
MEDNNPAQSLGIVLVVGGSGFIGTHVVQAFLDEPSCTAVHVVSKKPPRAPLQSPKIEYHQGNVTDLGAMQTIINKVNPRVILNLAYPGDLAKDRVLKQVVVNGTKNLLQCAAENTSVEAFVYTSTQHVARMSDKEINEEAHVWTEADKVNPYVKNKAIAETIVLGANSESLRTASVRVPGIYGEAHCLMIDGQLKRLRKGEHKVQIGDNSRLFAFIYAPSAASAHVLTAKALLAGKNDPKAPKVDGEAFFISDGVDRPFWDIVRDILAAAGDKTPKEQIKTIPFGLVLFLAKLGEWSYWVFTLGRKEPELRASDLEYLREGSHFSIDKARTRLGYRPLLDQEEAIRRSVKWSLEHEHENVEIKRQ